MKTAILFALTLSSSLLGACTSSSDDGGPLCIDGHCDTPNDTPEKMCKNSRLNAMDERRPHFTAAGVRWSCRDVNGVTADSNTQDDRGQEYCEYFTMLHTDGIPEMDTSTTCDPANADSCGAGATCDPNLFACVKGTLDTSKPADLLGKNVKGGTVTPLDPTLKQGQLDWLAANPDAKVGECVFTSWHKDITRMPTSTETVGGYSLTAKTPGNNDPLFRMEVGFNSNGAAKQLVSDCLSPGDSSIKDGYTRGCIGCSDKSCVPWRKSDPSVCTAAMRIAECGCTVTTASGKKLDLSKQADLATAQELFIPSARRGFALGTWDNPSGLPTGCRYVKTGDSTSYTVAGAQVNDPMADQNIVACDLKASHITAATAKDPKEACRATYGDDVVVHVRFPTPDIATLTCDTSKPKCQGAPWDFANL